MAQKVQVTLVDDIDEGPADETVSFSLDGAAYEIDLSAGNAAKMRDTLAPYIGVSRRIGGGRAPRGRRQAGRGGGGGNRTAEIRAWARDQGLKVSERGRIPATIVEQYAKSH